MESLLKVALLTALLLVLYGKVDAKFCGMRIRGSGELTYPSFKKKINPPKIFRTGLDKTTDCIVFGRIGWSRNLILNLTSLTANTNILMTTFTATKTENGVRQLSVMGEQSIQIEGNVSRYFELKFPITGISFTLTYTRKKARSLNGGVGGETITVDGRVCGETLRGNGRLSYSGAPIEREVALQKRETKCSLRGNVKWTNNLILNFRDVTTSFTMLIKQCSAGRPDKILLIIDDYDITLEGNCSKFFTIEFPRRGFNFTLTYTQRKSRSDVRCGPLERWTENIAGITCDKRGICDSTCDIQCSEGESFWPPLYSFDNGAPIFDEVYAECRPNASGTQVWTLEALTFDGELFSRRGQLNEESTLVTCEKPRCENLHESVEVISCTDQFYRHSHCTLQCKKGFVPFPGIEVTKSNSIYIFREDVQIPVLQFEATCREDLEYPNRGVWDNLTSADGYKAESCLNITLVKYLCLRRELPTDLPLFVPTNDQFASCPYSDEQLDVILGEKGALSLLGPILQESTQEQEKVLLTAQYTPMDCSTYCRWDISINDFVRCGTFKTPEDITNCLKCHKSKADGCKSLNVFGG